MTGNIKTFAAYLSISLVVIGGVRVEAADGARGQDSAPNGNSGDVLISRGQFDDRIGSDDGDVSDDMRVDELGTVARPRTIIPGAGLAPAAHDTGARPVASIVSRSIVSSEFGQAPVANFSRAGINDGVLGLQSNALGQGARAQTLDAARVGATNVAPDGVYNQFGFGVTAAAANSANPDLHSVHANQPNFIDADAYNSQFVRGFDGRSGDSGGQGVYENGYSPFLYDSSLYDRHHASKYDRYSDYGGDSADASENRGLSTPVAQPTVYVYAQPLTTPAVAPKPAVADQAGTAFDAARNAFKAGDYSGALELTDESIRPMPSAAPLREIRGLVLIALRRYEDAAGPLHDALAIGPGWNWPTLVGLYPNVSSYTEQLRALENYCNKNPRSASARFALAYLYNTQGNTDAAVDQLRQIIVLRPQDAVATSLIQRLEKTSVPDRAGGAGPR